MNKRKTIFISDIHLDETNPNLTKKFLDWLDRLDISIDALYILGDLFEFWIGDDDNTPFHQTIKQALNNAVLNKHIPIYFIHGNRDFLIGKNFLKEAGCIALSEEVMISLYGTPVLLMHGDTLCKEDHVYLRIRKLFHNHFFQYLFLLFPLSLRKKIAHAVRVRSKQYTQSAPKAIMDVTAQAVCDIMLKQQATYLIHGHTHRKKIHTLTLPNKQSSTRIVLGSWHDGANALYWYDSNQWEMACF
ncbi:MAG: UDP-2,3-diacylglucosamine hydrolase [uncultured bacterium]|nr:MAG: UDP-2,3-diacylglucosamine hydrolase [uncultured bacterium]